MNIFGITLHKLSYCDFFKEIVKLKKQTIVFTPNPEMLLAAKADKDFALTLKKADYLVPDGIGLYLAAQILAASSKIRSILMLPVYIYNIIGNREHMFDLYGDKIKGSDLTEDLLHYAEEKKIHISVIDPYFPNDVAKCTSQKNFKKNLKKVFPDLSFDFYVYNPDKKKKIIETIKKSETKMLFTTLGMKKQEKAVVEILKICPDIKLGLGVGSSFDYFIGFQKRAPAWLQTLELEWFYRVFSGPQKLKRIKRLWNAVVVFTFTVFLSK